MSDYLAGYKASLRGEDYPEQGSVQFQVGYQDGVKQVESAGFAWEEYKTRKQTRRDNKE